MVARTIAGLLHALAQEAHDLDVQVETRPDTPFWRKHVDAVRIQFSRLSFEPLSIGGLDPTSAMSSSFLWRHRFPDTEQGAFTLDRQLPALSCADEAFERLDADNSGGLDRDEIAKALTVAAATADTTTTSAALLVAQPPPVVHAQRQLLLRGLAAELIALYDFNGDGVVDRQEYQSMVEDMAALREAQEQADEQQEQRKRAAAAAAPDDEWGRSIKAWMTSTWDTVQGWKDTVQTFVFRNQKDDANETQSTNQEELSLVGDNHNNITRRSARLSLEIAPPVNGVPAALGGSHSPYSVNDSSSSVSSSSSSSSLDEIVPDATVNGTAASGVVANQKVGAMDNAISKVRGSITLSDLKLDLRRLLFGAIPIIKHITPGGPLVLEPFTVTISGSFNRGDIMESGLLDTGLRLLAAQALKRRVRSLRDFIDGAVFYGRTWKMSCETAPVVEVPELINVEFDDQNRLIITGRARIKPRSEVPVFEQSFKLRTKLGTRQSGQKIRLVEPELALVLECPKKLEEGYVSRFCSSSCSSCCCLSICVG